MTTNIKMSFPITFLFQVWLLKLKSQQTNKKLLLNGNLANKRKPIKDNHLSFLNNIIKIFFLNKRQIKIKTGIAFTYWSPSRKNPDPINQQNMKGSRCADRNWPQNQWEQLAWQAMLKCPWHMEQKSFPGGPSIPPFSLLFSFSFYQRADLPAR